MTQYELETLWITPEGIPGVTCRFSDLVRIKSSEHFGKTVEVISLISIEPEPIYMVELLPHGPSKVLPQSEIEPTGQSRGRTLKLMPPGSHPGSRFPS